LHSAGTKSAAIPIHNDSAAARYTGYAIANPGARDLKLRLRVLDTVGAEFTTLTPPSLNPLAPGRQVARFLHQDDPGLTSFRGSVVITDLDNQEFAVVALVEQAGLLTAVPVIVR